MTPEMMPEMPSGPAANRHLVIFAKAPRLGRVKSRLARDIGLVSAWKFYRHNLTQITNRMSADTRWTTWVAMTPDGTNIPGMKTHRVSYINQRGGDLGDRMGRVMANLPPGPVVIIGTDIPVIQRSDIGQAFQQLGNHDAVMGPAVDGGYWLVGLKRSPHKPHIFSRVRWSISHALTDTLKNLSRRNYKVHMLRELEDVDDASSYKRWKQS